MADDDSLMDKATGRIKQAAGSLSGDKGLKNEGAKEERKGEAKDELDDAVDAAKDKASEVENLERKT